MNRRVFRLEPSARTLGHLAKATLALLLLGVSIGKAQAAAPTIADFVLVDPATNTDLRVIGPGDVLDLTSLPGPAINIRAVAGAAQAPGSVRFELAGPRTIARTENGSPFALFGDEAGNFRARTLPLGTYTLRATAFSERHGRGDAGPTLVQRFELIKSAGDIAITRLVLVDSDTDRDLAVLSDGDTLDLTVLGTDKLTVRADSGGATPIGSVVLTIEGDKQSMRRENDAPYTLYGKNGKDLTGSTFREGTYTVTATPHIDRYGKGASGAPLTMSFSLERGAGDIAVSEFVLVDATTGSDLATLAPNAVLDLTALESDRFSIRANTTGTTSTGSVVFNLDGPHSAARADNAAPFSVFGGNNGAYHGQPLRPGTYSVSATPHISRGGKGAAGRSLALSFSVVRSAGDVSVGRLVLVDADTNTDIMPLSDGVVIDLTTIGSERFNVRAETAGNTTTESVAFTLRGPRRKTRSDNAPPFSIFGEKNGSYYGSRLTPGEYHIQAVPHVERHGRGSAGPATEASFSVIESAGDLAVTGFVVVDPASNRDMTRLRDGMVIDLDRLTGESLNVRAITSGSTPLGSVVLSLTGSQQLSRTDSDAPHALFGDSKGNYRAGRLGVGRYTLRGVPHLKRGGRGTAGSSLSVAFQIVRGDVDGSSSLLDAEPSPHDISVTDAVRFLTQSTFGPTKASIKELRQIGYAAWLNRQLTLTPSLHRAYMDRDLNNTGRRGRGRTKRMEAWFYNAVQAPDQLCQRVAFALSEIFVVSDRDPALRRSDQAFGLAGYYDVLVKNCFGSFRTLIEEVTLHPVMGTFLTSVSNQKADPFEGTMPDENYARELKQLFTIGLCELAQDGRRIPSADAQCTATFDQPDVEAGARVLTGWTYSESGANEQYGRRGRRLIDPMGLMPEYHDDDEKVVLGAVLPANRGGEADLASYLDVVFQHPNVGPFIARRLIQRLVTSNPSPGYIFRVAGAFNDNGSGVRGDLGAVVRVMLLDAEARSATLARSLDFGKVREPLLLPIALWRGLNAEALPGEYYRFDHPEDAFGQAPLRAPSVFNFFLPDYQHPGAVAELGLYSPELQIVDERRIVSTANALYDWVYYGRGRALYDIDEEIGVSEATCERLADHLAALFLAGQMSPALNDAIDGISCDTKIRASDRVRDSLYILLTSPEFSVQR